MTSPANSSRLTAAWNPYERKPHFPFAFYYSDEHERMIPVYLNGALQKGENDEGSVYFFTHEETQFDAEIYNPERHEGHLRCPGCCIAELHVNPGKTGRAGNHLLNQAGHFKTNADSEHRDDCKYKSEPREEHEYDDTLGYRVHLNLKDFLEPGRLSAVFDRTASLYYKGEKGRPKLKAEFKHLEKMRTFEIHEPKNLLTLLKRGDKERLNNSVFINTDLRLTEKEFLVRYSRSSGTGEGRFWNLYSRLEARGFKRFLPCIMEFKVEKDRDEIEPNAHRSLTSKKIFYYQEKSERGYDGRKHFIIPRAVPAPNVDLQLEAGNYLILGYASLGDVIEKSDTVIHYMDIKVLKPEQVLGADLDQMAAKIRKKQERVQKAANDIVPA